jgi:glycosyltransferase involved in cell wall biosynthesis
MSDATVRVSIGLPVYNGDNYLAEMIDSILAQSFTDFELIICDNASTDGTQAICEQYSKRDGRIHYFRNETNLGAAGNYNLAFEQARGEFFKWAAHDDLLAPDYLKCCVEAFERAPRDVILCYPRTLLIDSLGNPLRVHDDKMNFREESPHQRLARFARSWGMCNPVFGLMRRDVLAKTGLIRAYVSSDIPLLAELSVLGKFCELPEPHFHRRIHELSSRQGDLSLKEVATWFDPKAKGPGWINPRTQVFFRTLGIVSRMDLPRVEKIRCLVSFTTSWWLKRARVRLGALRRVLPGQRSGRL